MHLWQWCIFGAGCLAQAALILTGVGGLFELFLYYGFNRLRLEKAFCTTPAILFSALLYVLWHVGTQLPLEADPLAAAGKLFLVGFMYQSVFSLTRNVLVVWPIFHLVGVMLDFTTNIGGLDDILPTFPWAVAAVVPLAMCGLVLVVVNRRRTGARRAPG